MTSLKDNEDIKLAMNYPDITKQTYREGKKNITVYYGTISYSLLKRSVFTYITNRDGKFAIDFKKSDHELSDRQDVFREIKVKKRITDYLKAICQMFYLLNDCDDNALNTNYLYEKMIDEYNEFTHFFLNLKKCKLSKDLDYITASTLDEKNREHALVIYAHYKDSSKGLFQIVDYDLPNPNFANNLFQRSNNIIPLFDQFLAKIEILQPFFDLMDTLDSNCYIVDPENPSRSMVSRCIWLGDNIKVHLSFDAYNLSKRPDIKFLGPENHVNVYRTRLNDNLENWDSSGDIIQNLLGLLGIDEFPERPNKKFKASYTILLVNFGECSICFSLRLNGKMPEIVCKTKNCQKYYHQQCLYEWLTSVNAKRLFREVYGNCPNCEQTISCPIPDNF